MKCIPMRIWTFSLVALLFAAMPVLSTAQSNRPPNDDFASRIVLGGATETTNGSNVRATAESAEPAHAGFSARRSVWWSWTPAYSGLIELTTDGSDFDTVLAVYTGASLPSLNLVGANDDGVGSTASRVLFTAVAGTSYQIAVDGKLGASGSIVLNLRVLTPPNDFFDSAALLTGSWAFADGTNTNATAEPSEPQHAGVVSTNSVWWNWKAPCSSDVEIETDFIFGSGGEFDTLLAVYVGETLSSLIPVATNDDWNGKTTSRVVFRALGGEIYHIAVAGKSGASGSFILFLEILDPPLSDSLSNAIPFCDTSAFAIGSNTDATAEPGEPQHAGVGGGHSLWWNWIAPASGSVSLHDISGDFDSVLAVYTGGGFPLTPVAANYYRSACFAPDTNYGFMFFDAVAGESYQIAVDGVQGAVGQFTLSLELHDPPQNDNFASRGIFQNTPDPYGFGVSEQVANNLSATSEPNEPAHGGSPASRSVWWSWTAPTSSLVQVFVSTEWFTPRLGVYTGSSFPLSPIPADAILRASADNLMFVSRAGQTYQIALDSADDAAGGFVVTVFWGPRPANDDFSNATWLFGKTATVTNTFQGATIESGEPKHAGAGGNESLWYAWVAPFLPGSVNRPVKISTAGSGADTVLAVYTGSALSDLRLIVSNDDARNDDSFSEVSFVPVAGTTYFIAVAHPACRHYEPFVSLIETPVFMTLDYRAVSASLATLTQDRILSFTAGIDIRNHGTFPTGPLRVRMGWSTYCDNPYTHRLIPITSGRDGNPLEILTFPTPTVVAPGSQIRVQIEGTSPSPEQANQRLGAYFDALGVFAIIDENIGQEWLPLTQVFIHYWLTSGGAPNQCNYSGVLRSGGVVQGLQGQVEVAYLSIEAPAFVTAGLTVPIRVLAHLTGSSTPALVADPAWIVPPLVTMRTNASGTNFLLTAGPVCQPTNLTLTARFVFGGDESLAATSLTLLPPPFALQASLLSSNRSVLLHLTGPPTNSYVLEATDALGSPTEWQRFWTNPPNGDCSWLLTIPPATQTSHRYFRARQLP
jgi:hypothetical protein